MRPSLFSTNEPHLAPTENLVVNQLFGTVSGLGMGVITFDWCQIAYIGSPLMVPWWAQVHVFAGFVVLYWLVLPILYYTNVRFPLSSSAWSSPVCRCSYKRLSLQTWHLAYMPIGGQSVYDRFGRSYNTTRILDSTGRRFSLSNYEAYSALYLPGPYAIVYLLAFTLSTALLVHTALYHSRMIYNGIKRVRIEEEDVHAKLMRAYPEVPDSWYAGVCLVFFLMAIVAIEVWPTDMPVWALALSVLVPVLYLIPCGLIFATTSQMVPINLLAQIIPGVLLNGRPLANMVRTIFLLYHRWYLKKYVKATNKLMNMAFSIFLRKPDLQSLRDSDDEFGTLFYPGSQAGPLHESPSSCVIRSPGCRHAPLWAFASRCENGVIYDRPGYLFGRPEKHAHVST